MALHIPKWHRILRNGTLMHLSARQCTLIHEIGCLSCIGVHRRSMEESSLTGMDWHQLRALACILILLAKPNRLR